MTAALPTDLIVQRCDDRKWQYPEPLEDLDAWVSCNTDEFDPAWAHRVYWPDRPQQPGMEILVVDGGTTQGPVIARNNPNARVTATALNESSLAQAIYLRHKYQLSNLELHLLETERIAELSRTFDLIIASGALQHAGLAEAQLCMKALGEVLRPEGVAAFLLYSRYLPSAKITDFQTDEPPLHSGELNFTAQDCVELVEGVGLVFQDWLLKSPYYLPTLGRTDELTDAVAAMPERHRWTILDSLRNQTGCHLFMACRPDRPEDGYRIDLSHPKALDYVPSWRHRAGLAGSNAVRPNWSMPLQSSHQQFAEKIDGYSTIRQIAGAPELEAAAKELVEALWLMDFVTISTESADTWFGEPALDGGQ